MSRVLSLSEDVTEESIKDIISSIINWNLDDDESDKKQKDFKREPIKLLINTDGGSTYDGFGLVGVIESSKTPVYTICIGKALSMGLPILLSGHKRYIYKYGTVMYHEVSYNAKCKLPSHENFIEEAKRIQKLIDDLVLSKTSITKKTLDDVQRQQKEWYISADEAKELGIVDEIL